MRISKKKLFQNLSERKYKEYNKCQLLGCENEVIRKGTGKRNKYCCEDHQKKARTLYIKLWKQYNKEKISSINHRYYLKRKHENNKTEAI